MRSDGDEHLWRVRCHLHVDDVVKKTIAEDKFLFLRVDGNELAPRADAVSNEPLRVPHVQPDESVSFGRLDRSPNVLGNCNGCRAIHWPANRERHSAFGHQKKFIVRAWIGDEAVPQFADVSYGPALEPLKPLDQLREAGVRFVEHTLKTLVPGRWLATSANLDEVAVADDAEIRRRDADATPIWLQPSSLPVLCRPTPGHTLWPPMMSFRLQPFHVTDPPTSHVGSGYGRRLTALRL